MSALVVIPQDTRTTAERLLLEPLLRGTTVALRLNDPKLPRKRRVDNPTLYLQVVGGGKQLLISMPGYGCEVTATHSIQPLALMRVGLSMRSSKILCKALNELFK